jgi:3-hydroxyisobutyrate dehydrogenase-like beta-hydroxyacid dehydrogenase
METIAVIGLGQMGGAIAQRLQKQRGAVVGYDANPAARDSAAKAGVRVADSLAHAVEDAVAVLTCLPNSAVVDAVWLGKDGLADWVGAGVTCIELSSIDPDTMKRVARALQSRGASVLDCPVSGSPAEALEGKLVMLTGGDGMLLESSMPLLRHLSENIRHAGAIGAGKVVKIVNNMMTMANILAASEAFSLGVRAGVEPEKLLEILSVSGGRSAQFLKRFPWAVAGDFAPRFKMELGEKDLALGTDLGRAVGQPTPVASTARELYALALAEGHRGRDIVALYDMYQRWGGKPAH